MPRRRQLPLTGLAIAGLSAGLAAAPATADVATERWGRLLATFAHDGGLDYAALAESRGDLDVFLDAIAEARPEGESASTQMAFWINAYNAVVTHFVLDHYPELTSVKEVRGFFDGRRQPVAGEELTLDEIENRALALGDPRVHFAVVCASAGCPDLRPEPFSAGELDRQLEEQTRRFLSDAEKGLRFERSSNVLWLSSIFKWYADDFTGGSRAIAFFARGRVLDWVIGQVPSELAAELDEQRPTVRYLDYDWSLNDRPGAADGG